MRERTKEYMLGLFVLLGLICTAYLTIKLGRMEMFSTSTYTINAEFTSIAGLRSGANVEISGVQVGKVGKISLDPITYLVITELKINKGIELSEDTMASIKTSGLIGDKYIALSPGASLTLLQENDLIMDTEAPTDIEALISKYIFGEIN